MRTRTALPALLLALAAATTSCSSNDSSSESADKPSAIASASVSASASFTEADCLALLEKNYAAGAPQDVSAEPECEALSKDAYTELVGQVLTGHKDEILDDAQDEVIWDTAWDDIDTEAQTNICDLLLVSGVEAAEGLTREQAQYYLDNKC
ncbi:MAG: hypothetical protein HOZ81_28030 [Streptomyces sp.]|nr:hypothetical protein [Streptomyces sp.]